jgi:hypothetical protein
MTKHDSSTVTYTKCLCNNEQGRERQVTCHTISHEAPEGEYSFFNLDARWRWLVNSPLTPEDDPRDGLDRTENLAPTGFDPRTVQPVASCYTDCWSLHTRKKVARMEALRGNGDYCIGFLFVTVFASIIMWRASKENSSGGLLRRSQSYSRHSPFPILGSSMLRKLVRSSQPEKAGSKYQNHLKLKGFLNFEAVCIRTLCPFIYPMDDRLRATSSPRICLLAD